MRTDRHGVSRIQIFQPTRLAERNAIPTDRCRDGCRCGRAGIYVAIKTCQQSSRLSGLHLYAGNNLPHWGSMLRTDSDCRMLNLDEG